jgi:hypothetical protein
LLEVGTTSILLLSIVEWCRYSRARRMTHLGMSVMARVHHVFWYMLRRRTRSGILTISQLGAFCFFCRPRSYCVRCRRKAVIGSVIGLLIRDLETLGFCPNFRDIRSEIVGDSLLQTCRC